MSPTAIYTLSLHDALPIWTHVPKNIAPDLPFTPYDSNPVGLTAAGNRRSAEHTPELQSRPPLVCRLLLAQKKHEDGNIHPADHAGLAHCAVSVMLVPAGPR